VVFFEELCEDLDVEADPAGVEELPESYAGALATVPRPGLGVEMGLRDKVRRLERPAEQDLITCALEDGAVAHFTEQAYKECFLHEFERLRRHTDGEDPGPAHPMVEALRKAKHLEGVVPLHVQLAKEAGASREEVISAVLVGLPAAGQGVMQVLPVAIATYDAG
jgi:hypothetical protein